MTPAESQDARYRALADPIRRRLLRVLQDATDPCDVETLAKGVGLHPNTVRGHLDLLERAELVTRGTRPRNGPGRPRVVYRSSPGTDEPSASGYRLLAELLATIVHSSTDDPGSAAEMAGRSWGRNRIHMLAGGNCLAEDAEKQLVELLDEIGFEPHLHRQDEKLVIDLTDCPFRDLIEHHADVVCSLHLGLMRGAAEALGNSEVEELEPFAEPSLCRTVVRPPRTCP